MTPPFHFSHNSIFIVAESVERMKDFNKENLASAGDCLVALMRFKCCLSINEF
jgi:hypothetical protein